MAIIEFVKTIPPPILAGSGFPIILAARLWLLMRREAERVTAEFEVDSLS
jgi:hypothetical protein